jgi:hypothetical protein
LLQRSKYPSEIQQIYQRQARVREKKGVLREFNAWAGGSGGPAIP